MGKETSASTEHGTQTGGEGVGADLPGCSGFGNPVSDGVCIFHGDPEERRVGKECRSRWSPYH